MLKLKKGRILLGFTTILMYMVDQVSTRTYICGGHVDENSGEFNDGDNGDKFCFHVGEGPQSWRDARRDCRTRGGAIYKFDSFTPQPTTITELLTKNGITHLWTGLFVQDDRLVEDTPTSPESGHQQLQWAETSNTSSLDAQCVEQSCNIQPSENSFRPCDLGLRFRSCDDQLHYVCSIPAIKLGSFKPMWDSWERDGIKLFNVGDNLDIQMYLSTSTSSSADADKPCQMVYRNGRAFRLSNEGDASILTRVAINLGEFSQEIRGESFWVKDDRGICTALAQDYVQASFQSPVVTSYPCDEQLKVLCELDKTYEDEGPPLMVATIRSELGLIKQINQDILAHSEVIRKVGGLSPTNPNEGDGPPIGRFSLQIGCDYPQLTTRQGVTMYKSGVVTKRIPGREYEVRDPVEYFNLQINLSATNNSNGTYNIIDSTVPYSCDYNELNTHTVVSSDWLFVRPTDQDIFSVHFYLNKEIMRTRMNISSELFRSLANDWETQSFQDDNTGGELGPRQAKRQAGQQPSGLDNLLKIFQRELARYGYEFKPLVLRDVGLNQPLQLITYAHRPVPKSSPFVFTDVSKNRTIERDLQRLASSKLNDLRPLGVTRIQVRSIDWCWAATRKDDTTGLTFSLQDTRAPAIWKSPQTCAVDNNPLVTVTCRGDKIRGFAWGPTKVNPLCDYSSDPTSDSLVTDTLQDLSQKNITSENADSVAQDLIETINKVKSEELTPTDVNYVADVLQKITSTSGDLDTDSVKACLDSIDAVSKLPEKTLVAAQELGKSNNRLIRSFDKLGQRASVPNKSSRSRIVSGALGIEVLEISPQNDDNFIIGIKMLSGGAEDTVTYKELISQYSDESLEYNSIGAAIYLPVEFIKILLAENENSTESIRVSLAVTKITSLYRDPTFAKRRGDNSTINSKVVAGQVIYNDIPITDLRGYNVITVFEPIETVPEEERPNRTTCVFWDLNANEGGGGWSDEGCRYWRTTEGRDVCECDHLTNFAVLVNFYDQSELEHREVLGYITIVGLSLSIAGLAMSMLSFIFIDKLRKSRPQQALFQLSLAMLISWVIFLVGIERTSNRGGCIAVAALLHYFIMVSFMWMLVEGILQYLLFVRVMNSYFTNFMWKTGAPSWGLPLFPVIIIFAIDTDLYRGGEDYCWMDNDAFYFGFALPVGLIILTNLVIFVMVTVSLWRRKDMSKHSTQKSNQAWINIRASFICFCVLGLSWIFGFLAIENARLVFQYLFCITASLQGFIVFLMMTARDKQVRQYWKEHLCCWCPKFGKNDSSTSNSSNNKSGQTDRSSKPDPLHIPRVHSNRKKLSMTTETDANGDFYDIMGPQNPTNGDPHQGPSAISPSQATENRPSSTSNV